MHIRYAVIILLFSTLGCASKSTSAPPAPAPAPAPTVADEEVEPTPEPEGEAGEEDKAEAMRELDALMHEIGDALAAKKAAQTDAEKAAARERLDAAMKKLGPLKERIYGTSDVPSIQVSDECLKDPIDCGETTPAPTETTSDPADGRSP